MSSDIPVRLQNNLADRYTLERLIARGGMAAVYFGRDLKHDRAVAVKVLRPELGALLGAERFLREIKLVARLQHPHILPLYDSGEAEGTLYYVMPYVPGDSLRDRLRREKRLPLRDALWIAREVADALHYAHTNDTVHRDIKPENILLSGVHAMVADFGIARAVHVSGGERWETLTDSGVAIGTPAYMSPEQTAGEHDLDGRSDIYSLGCVVYEMLAGVPPFMGPDGEVMIAKRFTDPAPILRVLRDDVPESVDRAIQRALAKEPAERFANALEFTDAIWDDTHITGHARRSGSRVSRSTLFSRSNRNRALLGAGSVGVVGAAMLAAFWVTRSYQRPSSPATQSAAAPTMAAVPRQPARPANTTPDTAVHELAAPPPAVKQQPAPVPQDRPTPRSVSPEPQVRVPAVTPPRTDSVLSSLRVAARGARSRAVSDGASQVDLFRGDSLERAAEASAAGGRVADAISQLLSASTAWADGARAARSRTAQAAKSRETTAAPIPAPPPAVAAQRPNESAGTAGAAGAGGAGPSAEDQHMAVGAVIADYGRAIEARDIAAIKRLYPAITEAQQRDWQQFFKAVQNIKVSLSITELEISGATADARITGSYRYENTSARRLEDQPVSFHASLRRDGAGWRLTAIE